MDDEERDAAFEDGARSMRERVLAGVVDLLETHGTTDDLLNDVDRLHDLPLPLPTAGTNDPTGDFITE